MKPRVLICLYGLPRTFMNTAQSLFDNLIYPNKDKYDFDIIINTDFVGQGITYGRPDTVETGYSKYNYADINNLKDDLTKEYNKTNSLKHIQIYNFERKTPICPWYIVYKRIHMQLSYMYNQCTTPYDIYITHRIDTIFTRQINLDMFANDFTFITGDVTRLGFFHNYDTLDLTIIAPYKPFMIYMNEFISFCIYTCKLTDNYLTLFSDDIFCDKDLINTEIINIEPDTDILNKIKANHSYMNINDATFDSNHNKIVGNVISIDGFNIAEYLLNVLCKTFSIIIKNNKVVFGHNLSDPIYSIIIR